jgi:hypothetical protein
MTCGSDFHGKTKPAIAMAAVDSQGMDDEMLFALRTAMENMKR